jgi:FixJ family two-component response regulator
MSGEPMLVVVEDDDVFAKVLINNLAGAGFSATHFERPETAIAGVPTMARSDLLILDWRLPGMTGVDLLDRLRKLGCKAPALLLTSHDDVFYEEAALEAGAVDFHLQDPQLLGAAQAHRAGAGRQSPRRRHPGGDAQARAAADRAGDPSGQVEREPGLADPRRVPRHRTPGARAW